MHDSKLQMSAALALCSTGIRKYADSKVRSSRLKRPFWVFSTLTVQWLLQTVQFEKRKL